MWEVVWLLVASLVVVVAGTIAATVWRLTHPPRRTFATALAQGRAGDPSEVRAWMSMEDRLETRAPEEGEGEGRGVGSGWAGGSPDGVLAWESWVFRSRGLEFPVWDVRGMAADGLVVVMTHGWGDSRIGGLSRLGWLARVASRVVMWDMAGHGEAPGVCALGAREWEDLSALVRVVGEGRGVVLHGWSLGAGVSIEAAGRLGGGVVRGVIAESPYREAVTPARNVLRSWGYPHGVTLRAALAWVGLRNGVGARWAGFDRAGWAERLEVPLLVIHGLADEVCPAEDGKVIASRASRGRFEGVAGAGHHGLWTEAGTAARCAGCVAEFLSMIAG